VVQEMVEMKRLGQELLDKQIEVVEVVDQDHLALVLAVKEL
jgi:hypothetical protein